MPVTPVRDGLFAAGAISAAPARPIARLAARSSDSIARASRSSACGGCMTAVYNAANEEAAEAFLAGRIRFPAIVRTIADVLHAADQWAAEPATVEDVLDAQRWARERARAAVSQEVASIR